MPQKWEQYWNADACPGVSAVDGERIVSEEQFREARSAAIYELGNMTL